MDFTLYKGLRNAFDWLLPKSCINCDQPLTKSNYPCCEHCYPALPFQSKACFQCGERFAADRDYCGHCLSSPPNYDACFCPFAYSEPISEQIIRMKYRNKPELAAGIAQLLAREIDANRLEIPELIVPVPMHIKRLRQRGYNHASLLAVELGSLLDIPVQTNVLRKSKATPQQATQSLKRRKSNLVGSFSIKKDFSAKSVAIVDDVVTTGSTAGEIAKILKKNGVDYIQVWGVTHTL